MLPLELLPIRVKCGGYMTRFSAYALNISSDIAAYRSGSLFIKRTMSVLRYIFLETLLCAALPEPVPVRQIAADEKVALRQIEATSEKDLRNIAAKEASEARQLQEETARIRERNARDFFHDSICGRAGLRHCRCTHTA